MTQQSHFFFNLVVNMRKTSPQEVLQRATVSTYKKKIDKYIFPKFLTLHCMPHYKLFKNKQSLVMSRWCVALWLIL